MSFSLFIITGASALAIITPMGLPKIKNQITIKKRLTTNYQSYKKCTPVLSLHVS